MILDTEIIIFILSSFIGYYIIWNITPTLHAPLMSVSNAISGIIILGAFTTLENAYSTSTIIISFLAIICASINIFGGFALSLRMLNFLKPQKKKEQTHE